MKSDTALQWKYTTNTDHILKSNHMGTHNIKLSENNIKKTILQDLIF